MRKENSEAVRMVTELSVDEKKEKKTKEE